MAEVLFEIPEWLDYEDYDNYPSESKPTTNADFINYSRNQNKLVGALTSAFLWQPNTNFIAGKIIITPNMPEGMEAVALTGGLTGTVEPGWKSDIAEYQDSGVKWQLRYQHWSKEVEQITDLTTGATNRLPNTSYVVGNVVYNKSNLSVAFKCTTAGTTSNTELDISSRAVGESVEDGSVVWVVVKRDLSEEVKANADNFANYLPLSGGTMTGSIYFNPDKVICGVGNKSYMQMRGGTERDDGARITIYGTEYGGGTYSGVFQITTAGKDGSSVNLFGYPDGRLTWNTKNIALQGALSMPYTGAGGITISASALTGNGYTVPNDGWVVVSCTSKATNNASWARIYNNERQALSVSQSMYSGETGRLLFPIAKNGVVKMSKGENITINNAYFYPAQSEV